MQLCLGHGLKVDYNGEAVSSSNYKDCSEFTKVHAINMFHNHIWPKVSKEGSKYEVTNCLEKNKTHPTGHSDYEIVVQMGDKTCSFKLKYDSSKPVDQRVLLNDIEEEIKLCSEDLKNHPENQPKEEEIKYFTKPIMDAYFEYVQYPEQKMETEETVSIQLDEPVTDFRPHPEEKVEPEQKTMSIQLVEPVTDFRPYPKEETHNEEQTMSIQLVEPVSEYIAPPQEVQTRTIHLIEPVTDYRPYPGEEREKNTEWQDCSDEQLLQVADNFDSLVSAHVIHPVVIYTQNLKECKAAKEESRFLYTLSFNFKVCKFHVDVKESGVSLVNFYKLRSDDCKVHLKETPRTVGRPFR